MRYLIVGIVFFLGAIIQASFINNLELFGVKPNLFVILIICFSLLNGSFRGGIIGFIGGLIQDIVSCNSIGGHALLGMYLGIGVGTLNKRFFKDNIVVVMLAIFIGSLIYETTLYFFALFIFGQTEIFYFFKKIILPEAIYNAVVGLLVFLVVVKVEDWIKNHTRVDRIY